MMSMLRRATAIAVFGWIASTALDAAADSATSADCIYPGGKAVPSTTWDVGTVGIRNWRRMLTRWADGADCASDTCSSAGWPAIVAQVKAAGGVEAQLKRANALVNDPAQHPYREDTANWNAVDYWETPYEFLKKSGDAEDTAIAKYFLLKAAGIPADDMQIVVVRLKSQGDAGHALLAVRADRTRRLILDNRVAPVLDATLVKDEFEPVLGLNETGWCAYSAPQ